MKRIFLSERALESTFVPLEGMTEYALVSTVNGIYHSDWHNPRQVDSAVQEQIDRWNNTNFSSGEVLYNYMEDVRYLQEKRIQLEPQENIPCMTPSNTSTKT